MNSWLLLSPEAYTPQLFHSQVLKQFYLSTVRDVFELVSLGTERPFAPLPLLNVEMATEQNYEFKAVQVRLQYRNKYVAYEKCHSTNTV